MDMPVKLEQFVETFYPKRTLNFYFYEDGKLDIFDATSGEVISLSELNRESEQFYVQQRIAFIKNLLIKSILNHQ